MIQPGSPIDNVLEHRVRLLQLQPRRHEQEPAEHSEGSPRCCCSPCRCSRCCCSCGCRSAARCRCKPEGYRFKADFPEAALLAKEADVRMAGVNVGKVRSTELGPGGRTHRGRDRARRRASRRSRSTRARSCARRACWGRPTWSCRRGRRTARTCPTAGRCGERTSRTRSSSTRSSAPSTRRTRRYFQEWLHDAGHRLDGPVRLGPQRLARQRRAVLRGRRRPAAPAGRAGGGAAPRGARHRPRVRRGLARGRPAARADHQRAGHVLGARVARRCAGRDVPDPAHVPARDAHDGRAAGALRAQHRPARARPARAGRRPGADACATSATCRRTSRSCSATSARSWTPRRPACRRPSASSRAREPLLESTHVFLRELNPILAYLSFSRGQLGAVPVARRLVARRDRRRAATRPTARASTTSRSWRSSTAARCSSGARARRGIAATPTSRRTRTRAPSRSA